MRRLQLAMKPHESKLVSVRAGNVFSSRSRGRQTSFTPVSTWSGRDEGRTPRNHLRGSFRSQIFIDLQPLNRLRFFFWQNSTPHCNLYYIAQKVYCELMWIIHFSVPHVESLYASRKGICKVMMPDDASRSWNLSSPRELPALLLWNCHMDGPRRLCRNVAASFRALRMTRSSLWFDTWHYSRSSCQDIGYYMSYNIYRPCKLDAAVLPCAWCRGFAVVAPHTSQVFALLSTVSKCVKNVPRDINDEHIGSEACSSIQLIRNQPSLSSAGMELGGDQQVHGLFAGWQVAQFGSYKAPSDVAAWIP